MVQPKMALTWTWNTPSTLAGEGWGEGKQALVYVAAQRSPHPALRATFSRKGRRERTFALPRAKSVPFGTAPFQSVRRGGSSIRLIVRSANGSALAAFAFAKMERRIHEPVSGSHSRPVSGVCRRQCAFGAWRAVTRRALD
ncbi:MAG: hypothetical protein E6R11_00365 [Rhodocyclaceae bacterium]|nr:MAG: hypothetical protein E6R11_00365 [Rhodocyclaceae bacterium]